MEEYGRELGSMRPLPEQPSPLPYQPQKENPRVAYITWMDIIANILNLLSLSGFFFLR